MKPTNHRSRIGKHIYRPRLKKALHDFVINTLEEVRQDVIDHIFTENAWHKAQEVFEDYLREKEKSRHSPHHD